MFRNFSTFPFGTTVYRVVSVDDSVIYQGDDYAKAERVAWGHAYSVLSTWLTQGEHSPKWIKQEEF